MEEEGQEAEIALSRLLLVGPPADPTESPWLVSHMRFGHGHATGTILLEVPT